MLLFSHVSVKTNTQQFLFQSQVDERVDHHKAIHHLSGSCSGWRYGANSGVPVCSDSPGHFN